VKNKILLISVAVMLVIGLVVGCAKPAPAPAPAPTPAPTPTPEVKTLSAVCLIPGDFILMKPMLMYADWVKEYSNGELVIDILGDGEVIPTEEQIFAVGGGTVDMIFSCGDDISQASPVGYAMMGLANMKPWEERESGLWDFWRETLARDCNVYWLGHYQSPLWNVLTTNVAAKSPDEVKGLKIRCGATHFGSVKAVGAVPVSTPMSDIYTSMERGIVDGFVFPAGGWPEFGWQEVTKYWVGPRINYIVCSSCPLINLDVWNSLSQEEQGWLTQPLIDHEEELYAFIWWVHTGDVYGEEAILNAGLERIEWSDEDNKWFQDIWKEAYWDYVEGKMDSTDFTRLEKLVGH